MTRRDMIIIAALINAGLLAIIFMLAINSEDESSAPTPEPSQLLVETAIADNAYAQVGTSEANPSMQPVDEGDRALQEFQITTPPLPVIPDESMPSNPENAQDDNGETPSTEQPSRTPQQEPVETSETAPKIVKVTVKKGDSLDKIARANGTTVKAIKDENKLKNDRLDVGQVLNVPVGNKKEKTKAASKEVAENKKSGEKKFGDPEYYTIKKGDNPWKIAKKNHIKVSELLKLNNMDEEKARNLKAGDKIRIK